MIKIGMMIVDRYEILEKIGTGGMSDVYKAKDHKLNRFVAVKVLKQEFSENANFVSKFRIEAQAGRGMIQLLPGIHETDGFFFARLKKGGEPCVECRGEGRALWRRWRRKR